MSGNCKQFGKSSIKTLNKVLTKDETHEYILTILENQCGLKN